MIRSAAKDGDAEQFWVASSECSAVLIDSRVTTKLSKRASCWTSEIDKGRSRFEINEMMFCCLRYFI